MKHQPDFRKLFYDYFGRTPKKVTYSIRPDSNRNHDLMFLKSLIHDARIKRSAFKIRGKRLTIQLKRDCWELVMVEYEKHSELYTANSRLSISPVVDVEWRFNNGRDFSQEAELWIHDVIITSQSFELLKVEILGDGWSLRMKAYDEDFKMRIQDLEVPYLFSQKTKTQ